MPVSIDPWWRRASGRATDAGRDAAEAAASRWRRSLRLRVVATTLLLSSAVVALFVGVLVEQVGRGLVEDKTRSALVEARSGLLTADGALAAGGVVGQDQVKQVADQLVNRGAAQGLYDIVLLGTGLTTYTSQEHLVTEVPQDVLDRLDAERGPVYSFAPVRVDGVREEQALVVGSVLQVPDLGQYRLVHVFPLGNERETLQLVQRTAAGAGLLLVGLLGLIAALVTRQVVTPVRMAARTAERLAAGRLEERMQVRGEDEMARLGSSFNSMADNLQKQIRQLEDLSRVQRRFVSDVSHELRTPITTVRMAADVLFASRNRFEGDVARSAELLQDELDRFEALLADLLEISRYDAGAAALDASPVDLVRLVHRAVEAAQPLADRKGSRFDLSGVPDGPVVAEVDPVRLERVLRNLVVNAVEHGEGRPVELAVAGTADTVAVRVRDHGVGLQPGQAGMVFTRFWRADPSRARSTGGTGLGLAIALEDVRLHGGFLQAVGHPGQGAAFLVTLPVQAGRSPGDSPLDLPFTGGTS